MFQTTGNTSNARVFHQAQIQNAVAGRIKLRQNIAVLLSYVHHRASSLKHKSSFVVLFTPRSVVAYTNTSALRLTHSMADTCTYGPASSLPC